MKLYLPVDFQTDIPMTGNGRLSIEESLTVVTWNYQVINGGRPETLSSWHVSNLNELVRYCGVWLCVCQHSRNEIYPLRGARNQ